MRLLGDNIDAVQCNGLTLGDVNNMLTFICYNYEVAFNGILARQTSGVPMGARFAPPFAIITMHYIETEALHKLALLGIVPVVYYRYIDDIIIGPLQHDRSFHETVLHRDV